jgi:hypothetical protein
MRPSYRFARVSKKPTVPRADPTPLSLNSTRLNDRKRQAQKINPGSSVAVIWMIRISHDSAGYAHQSISANDRLEQLSPPFYGLIVLCLSTGFHHSPTFHFGFTLRTKHRTHYYSHSFRSSMSCSASRVSLERRIYNMVHDLIILRLFKEVKRNVKPVLTVDWYCVTD